MSRHLPLRFLLLLAALVAPHRLEATNGAKPMAFSPAAAGRGGADIALSEDSTAINLNPAGLANVPWSRADLYFSIITAKTYFANEFNDDETPLKAGIVPTIGAILRPEALRRKPPVEYRCPTCNGPIPAEAYACFRCGTELAPLAGEEATDRSPWTFGIGIFGQTGGGGTSKYNTRLHPEGIRNETQFGVVSVAPAAAYRLNPRLSLGAALHLIYAFFGTDGPVSSRGGESTSGDVYTYWDVGGNPIDPPTRTGGKYADLLRLQSTNEVAVSSVDAKVKGAEGTGFNLVLGALWRPTERLSLGLAYTTPSIMTPVEGRADIDAAEGLNDLLQKGGITATFFKTLLPDQGRNGFAQSYKFKLENFKLPQQLGIGAAWLPVKRWRLSGDLRWINWSSTFDEVKIVLTEGSNRDINALTGSDGFRTTTKFFWNDQWVVALGAEYFAGRRLALRAGYNWGENPSPKKTLGVTGGATVEHHATAGFGYRFDWGALDFSYYHAFQKAISINQNESPDAENTRIKQLQNVFFVGISRVW